MAYKELEVLRAQMQQMNMGAKANKRKGAHPACYPKSLKRVC
jgi:hypothetical protein